GDGERRHPRHSVAHALAAVLAAGCVEPSGAGGGRGDMVEIGGGLCARARGTAARERGPAEIGGGSVSAAAGAGRLGATRVADLATKPAASPCAVSTRARRLISGRWCLTRAISSASWRSSGPSKSGFTWARAAIGGSPSKWKVSNAWRNWGR